ncbi:MAG: ribose 5-phosphate isomerase B [Bacteroidota bacterium]
MNKKIAIGGDHGGYDYKNKIIPWLEEQGYTVKDFGPHQTGAVDYPDHVHPLCDAIERKEFELGILICGSGNGVAITANKHPGVRAALCWNAELAKLARAHNNANVICLGARFTGLEFAQTMIFEFLQTDFEGGRHQTRVNKINC